MYNSYSKLGHLHIHEYSLIFFLFFVLQTNSKKSGNKAVLDLFVFYFQNILGNISSYFLEMVMFKVSGVCSFKKELGWLASRVFGWGP